MLAGDLSALRAGEGWPHAETLLPLRAAAKYDAEPGWLVTLDGIVIGDCHTHGPADDAGDVEIRYGLAEPYRGFGYARELVRALSPWLLDPAETRPVVARQVAIGE